MCKCRAFAQAKRDYCYAGKHVVETINLFCKMCNKNIKRYSNHIDGDYMGASYECMNCHSYVQYLDEPNVSWKEEFYFDDLGILLINDFIDNKSYLCSIDSAEFEPILTLPLIDFDKETILNKIKTYILFS
ncbi:hypothetical protein UFOVP1290_426 [uncultured Caudovirales phage]|uniref:Uncharacterized protein n=1 Tax=uncultured Caudovirales phage TaxID=2100421 RepID=A0A6J5RRN2_9CAUD|nr:hypothetical protein UFOVP1290_426 [uncultured Caudovirales phage]